MIESDRTSVGAPTHWSSPARVRMACAIDCHDREIIGWLATMPGAIGAANALL